MQVQLDWVPLNGAERRPAVLYIEHLETAPWNLERYVGKSARLYTRVGSSLMVVASMLSEQFGLSGGVGLHSLELSEGFYRQLRFGGRAFFQELGLGYLSFPELRYFEHAE